MYSEPILKVSSTFDLKKSIKIHYVLQVQPWSLGGQDGSWYPWSWCQHVKKCILNQYCKFHQLLTWKSPSRLSVSSKFNLGVLEDRMVPDIPEIGVKMLINIFWAYSENFIQFWLVLHCQDSPCPRSQTLESWMTGSSWHEEWHVGCLLKVYYVTGIFWSHFQASRSLQSLDIVFT